ncbi:MAG: hypothetical protein ABW007_07990 [Chitinophagaceae bacterium]
METNYVKIILLSFLFCLPYCCQGQTVSWSLNGVRCNIDCSIIREGNLNKIHEAVVIYNKSDKDIYIPTTRGVYAIPGIGLVQKIGVLYKDLRNMGPDSGYLVLTLLKAGEKMSFDMSCVIDKLPKDFEMTIASDFLFADKIGQNGLDFIDNITVDGAAFPSQKGEKVLRLEKYKAEATLFIQNIKVNFLASLFNQH